MGNRLSETLEELLKSDERLVSSKGELLKNRVQELVENDDPILLESVYNNSEARAHFFLELKKTSLFQKEKFLQFVTAKEWLADSFTAYKNKIGLTYSGGTFIGDSGEVILDWPFKDCILEGGMKEDEASRSEVFYNQTLAPDEVNRLLENKTFVNAKRVSRSGEAQLKEFNFNDKGGIIDNLLIRGNNLLGLSSIKEVFARKIKLIYIDPPYNRDAESFYNDSFKRSTWLTFMKNRLELARQLLQPDGIICIQIDEAQFAYLKVLADEVFNQQHLNTIVVKMSEASGVKMSHVDKRLPKVKEYILIYARDLNAIKINTVKIPKKFTQDDSEYLKYYSKIIVNPENKIEKWVIIPLKEYCLKNKIEFANKNEEISFKIKNAEKMVYRTNNSELAKLNFSTPLAKVISATGLEYIWWEGKQLLKLSDYLSEGLVDLWTDISTINLNKEGGVDFPNGKKPEALVQRLLQLFTAENDLVLDFHLGSGTTAAVAHKMNRQYIGIEQLDYGKNDPTHRLKNVINGDNSGISKNIGWNGGGEFVYLELAERNPKLIERISKSTTMKQLVTIWDEISQSPYLSHKVDLMRLKDSKTEFLNLTIAESKDVLIEILDKNAIYVNISELEDKSNGVSSTDIAINKSFYGLN
jgi:adenine-specific DNA-methyltransferase